MNHHFKKGKGKGKSRGFMWTRDDALTYLQGKGKGKHSGSSGKGFGRRSNPKDRAGVTLKCRICDSEEHFATKCPQGKGASKGSGKSGFLSVAGGCTHSDGRNVPEVTTTPSDAPPWAALGSIYFNSVFMASQDGEDTSNLMLERIERRLGISQPQSSLITPNGAGPRVPPPAHPPAFTADPWLVQDPWFWNSLPAGGRVAEPSQDTERWPAGSTRSKQHCRLRRD